MDPFASIHPIAPDLTHPQGTPRLDQPQPADSHEAEIQRLRKASGDFESLFLAQLLKPMQQAVQSGSSSKSFGGGIMLDVATEKLADGIAHQGGIGLGKLIFESMQRRLMSDSAAIPEPGKPIPLRQPDPPRALQRAPFLLLQPDKAKQHEGN